MYWEQRIRFAAISDTGSRRQNNQDAFVVRLAPTREDWAGRGHLFVVADGMGGHAVGELASKMAIDVVPHTFEKLRQLHPFKALQQAVETANQRIHERGKLNQEFLRMGTTCSALLLGPQGAFVAHVGDSRVYRIRQQIIDQLTRDHSLVWELVEQRRIKPKDADRLFPRNVITRSLGPEATVQVDLEGPTPVQPGDIFVLCTDGLSSVVHDEEIGALASELSPDAAAQALVHLANLRGGPDNITVIVVHVGEVPQHAETTELPIYETPASGSWGTFVFFCVLSVIGLTGLTLLLLTEHRWFGGLLLGGVFLGGVGWWLSRPRPAAQQSGERNAESTIIWRPYRTASARLTPPFVMQMGRYLESLMKAAEEEGWPVAWNVCQQHYQAGQQALVKKHYAHALRHFCDTINLLLQTQAGESGTGRGVGRTGREGKSTISDKTSHGKAPASSSQPPDLATS
ncbi:MAG: hypothetical protein KatS3mg113_0999 [Planctomycetaceae bacterium]|nr:MAG: hypothetical protein KatS3mg113_0999 [Planctomycetaceae bacterium]